MPTLTLHGYRLKTRASDHVRATVANAPRQPRWRLIGSNFVNDNGRG
ncbi:MAG TPA: hypothetical protein VNR60_02595 [Croceibacterium sp.]|nr:hypothetical protein [Croceibacterium sp.]